jgi:hypothetical protein
MQNEAKHDAGRWLGFFVHVMPNSSLSERMLEILRWGKNKFGACSWIASRMNTTQTPRMSSPKRKQEQEKVFVVEYNQYLNENDS